MNDTMYRSQAFAEQARQASDQAQRQSLREIGGSIQQGAQAFTQGLARRQATEIAQQDAARQQQELDMQSRIGAARLMREKLEAEQIQQKMNYYNQELDLRMKAASVKQAEFEFDKQMRMSSEQRARDPYFNAVARGRFPIRQKDGQFEVGRYRAGQMIWEPASAGTMQYLDRRSSAPSAPREPDPWEIAQDAARILQSDRGTLTPQQRMELQNRVDSGLYGPNPFPEDLPDAKWLEYRRKGYTAEQVEFAINQIRRAGK
jgi:hypothetical protein